MKCSKRARHSITSSAGQQHWWHIEPETWRFTYDSFNGANGTGSSCSVNRRGEAAGKAK